MNPTSTPNGSMAHNGRGSISGAMPNSAPTGNKTNLDRSFGLRSANNNGRIACEKTRRNFPAGDVSCTTAPDQDAVLASVFWEPAMCSSVLRLTAQPCRVPIDATPFELSEIPCPSVLLELPSGPQHLLFRDESRRLQLVVGGADVMKPVHLLTNGAPDKEVAVAQLRSLHCFNDLRFRDGFTLRISGAHRCRSGCGCVACSGWRNRGCLAGRDRGRRSSPMSTPPDWWHAPGQPLRDRVRRALYRGHALMRGGYRELLS